MGASTQDTPSKNDLIVDVAMRHFAELGFRGARVEDIASEVGVAKGTVFLHFRNKEGLFLAAYERAVSVLPAWLDAPQEIVARGFWAVLDYWLERTEEFLSEQWVPNRVAMIGRYDTGLGLRRPISRFMRNGVAPAKPKVKVALGDAELLRLGQAMRPRGSAPTSTPSRPTSSGTGSASGSGRPPPSLESRPRFATVTPVRGHL